MIQEKLVDFTTLPNPQSGTKFIGFDLDGKYKSKDSSGVVTEIGSGQQQGSGGTFTFVKHSSMSPTGNVGLGVMVDVFPLNNNPQSVADFEVTAKISNTILGTPGQKGRVEFMMPKQPYIEPQQQEDKIIFNRKPQDTDQFNISGVGSGYNIAFSNLNDNANEINVSNKSFKDVIDSLILKLQNNQPFASAGDILQTDYGFTNQLNTAGSRFTGSGINDLRILNANSTQENTIEVEVIANGFDIFEFSSVGGTIQNGATIVGDTSAATATALFTTDMGGGLFWTRVKVTSGTFTPTETVTIDGNFGATYNNFTFQTTNDLLKFSNQVFNQPIIISYQLMSGATNMSINSIDFQFTALDTGHTVGDKWTIETKYGAVEYPLSAISNFTIGETVVGSETGANGIVVAQSGQVVVLRNIAGGFKIGETITGQTSSEINTQVDYNTLRFFGEPFFRIKWNYNGSQQSSYYTSTTFVATIDTFNIQNEVAVTSVNDYDLASEIKTFCDNNQYIFSINTWYNGGNILTYFDVFKNTNNPNGTLGGFGIKFFANAAEMQSAINWALLNTGNFNYIFNLISITDVNPNQIKILAETTQTPDNPNNNYLQVNIGQVGQNIFYSYITSQIAQQAIATVLEAVRNTIIGVIVEETATHVTIKDGLVYNVKLASQVDGEVGCLPYTDEMQNPANFLVAWRNGTFISYYALYLYFQSNNLQLRDNYLLEMGKIRGLFKPLDKAEPGQMVLAAREFAVF